MIKQNRIEQNKINRRERAKDKTQENICFAQLSSENIHHVGDGNKYRNPQSYDMQRVRVLGMLSPKMVVSVKSLPSKIMKPYGIGGR